MSDIEKSDGPTALFDLDGTMADFDGALRKELEAIAGPNDPPIPVMFGDSELPWMKARRRLVKAKPGFWRNLPRLELGFHILDIAKSLGFSNYVLSKGPTSLSSAWTEKHEWCQKHVPGLPVFLADQKDMVYGKVLVDDWPDYFLPWLKRRPRGLVVSVAHPWNQDVKHPRMIRYDGKNREEVLQRMWEVREAYQKSAKGMIDKDCTT